MPLRLAARVDHDPKRVAVLLKPVPDRKVAEFRRVAVPTDGVASGPVPRRHRADFEGHADAVTGVKARAANLRELPGRPKISCAHFSIGLKAAGREHDAL